MRVVGVKPASRAFNSEVIDESGQRILNVDRIELVGTRQSPMWKAKLTFTDGTAEDVFVQLL